MTQQLLDDAVKQGQFLIQRGVVPASVISALFKEYRAHVERGSRESFAMLLSARGLLSPDQASALVQAIKVGTATAAIFEDHLSTATEREGREPTAIDDFSGSSERLRASRGSSSRVPGIPLPDPSQADASRLEGSAEVRRRREIGGYEITGTLGRGGQGVVYSAVRNGRRVALKLMNNPHAGERARKRFKREREVMLRLDHPNIVKLIASGSAKEGEWIAMELVDGKPLDDLLESTVLTRARRLDLFEAVCGAVHAAHEEKVIHRDIKPSNILVGDDGTAKIMDFGLAKKVDGTTMLTAEGAIVGTPAYLAPEQISFEVGKITVQTDVYALGVLLFELLTDERPFTAQSAQALYRAIMEVVPDRPSHLDNTIDKGLDAVCLKAMHKDPALRYATAAELAEDVINARAGRRTDAARSRFKERFKSISLVRRVTLFVVLPLVLIVGSAAGWRGWQSFRRARALAIEADGMTERLKESIRGLRQARETAARETALDGLLETEEAARAFITRAGSGEAGREIAALIDSRALQAIVGPAFVEATEALVAGGAWSAAAARLEDAGRWLPPGDPAHRRLAVLGARIAHETGRSKEALEQLAAELDKGHASVDLHALQARILEGAGDLAGAAKALEAAASLASLNGPHFLAEQARVLDSAGRQDEADAIFASITGPKAEVPVLVSWSRALRRRGDLDAAATALARAKSLAPEDPDLRRESVAVLVARGRLAAALADLGAALAIRKNDFDLHLEHAGLALELGRLDLVKRDLRNAASLALTDGARARLLRSQCLDDFVRGRDDELVRRLDQARERLPRDILTARMSVLLAGSEEARGAALRALEEITGGDGWTTLRRAEEELAAGRAREALKLLDALPKDERMAAPAQRLAARCSCAAGDEEVGLGRLRRLAGEREAAVRAGRGRSGRGVRLASLSKSVRRRGVALLRLAWLDDPSDPEVLRGRARFESDLSPDQRLGLALRACRSNPFCPRAWVQLGEVLRGSSGDRINQLRAQAVESGLELPLDGFDRASLLLTRADLELETKDIETTLATVTEAEEACGSRLWKSRRRLLERAGLADRAAKLKKREKSVRKRFEKDLKEAFQLTKRSADQRPNHVNLAKARTIIDRMRKADPGRTPLLLLEGRYYLAGEEGISTTVYLGAQFMREPDVIFGILSFAARMVEYLATLGVDSKIPLLSKRYELGPGVTALNLAVVKFLGGLSGKSRASSAEAILRHAEEAMAFNPESPAPWLMRIQAHRMLGREPSARQDENVLIRCGCGAIVYGLRVFTLAATGRVGEAIRALREARKRKAPRSWFTSREVPVLQKLRREPEFLKLIDQR